MNSQAKPTSHPAVADGTISAEAAYCGLNPFEVTRLQEKRPTTLLLVRYRGRRGDWREILPAYRFCGPNAENVRDVFLAPEGARATK